MLGRAGVGALAGARDDIGDKPLVAALVVAGDDGDLRDGLVLGEHRLDLAGLDAEAADLHLVVGAAE